MKMIWIIIISSGVGFGIVLNDTLQADSVRILKMDFFPPDSFAYFVYLILIIFICLNLIFTVIKVYFCRRHKKKLTDFKTTQLLLFLIIGILIGFWRMNSWHANTQAVKSTFWGTSAEVSGTLDSVEYRLTHGVGYLSLDMTSQEKIFLEPNIRQKPKIRFTFSRSQKLLPGDALHLSGKLREPNDFVTEAGRIFSYKKFLARNRVYAMMSYPKISTSKPSLPLIKGENQRQSLLSQKNHINQGGAKNFFIKRKLFQLKYFLLSKTNAHLHEPYAGLAGGILYGEQGQLTRNLQEVMRRTGIIHIVVLSGYNITIIAVIIFALLKRVSKIPRYTLAALFMLGFMVLTGASATTVRATVMSLIMICGSLIGRPNVIIKSLSYALIIMCMINPSYLLYDPGFQLSFLATIGLVCLGAPMMCLFRNIPERFGLREHASATFSTQVTVLPALSVMTGEVSTVAPFVNLIVLPFVPFAMLASFLTQLFASLHSALGNIGVAAAQAPLWLMIHIPVWFDTHFQSSLWLPILPLWIVVATYILMIPLLIWGYHFNKNGSENSVLFFR